MTIFAVTKLSIGMVYFKYLFLHMKDLSPNEGLVYSELLLHSLTINPQYLSGKLLHMNAAREEVENFKIYGWGEEVEYYPMEIRKIMKLTELSFPTVKEIVSNLQEKGYIRQHYIKCPLELLNEGYIKIPFNTRLKGRHLTFYAFLLDRSYKHGKTVDTWAYRFEALCGIKEGHVYNMINHLKAKGLVGRLEDGKLKVIVPKQ